MSARSRSSCAGVPTCAGARVRASRRPRCRARARGRAGASRIAGLATRGSAPTILGPPMRCRLILLTSLLVLLVLAGAGSVYAFDHTRQDRIAKGVQVNGVDVG